MGRRGGKRGSTARGRGGRSSVRVDYPDIPKTNPLFEGYYNSLGIFKDDEEQQEFWAAMRRELPNSFRFTGSKGHALQVQHRLEDHYLPEITSINFEDQPVDPPVQLSWFPDKLAWHMTTPKKVVRRFPPFASFQKFLVSETAVGNISRQEVVSMIPPLMLEVKPGMTVLDLCAAPGSKSAQLTEMVHGGEEARMRKVVHDLQKQNGRPTTPKGEADLKDLQDEDANADWSDDGRTTGLLIANDVDYKRAHMLIHQMKRLNSPNLLVTNHDATAFPSIKLKSLSTPGQTSKGRYLKFDRILADVPCSGDGTPRKNYSIWRDWKPMNGIGLHLVQTRILVRALQMLKVGGRVVYSTCSLNPIENEAIVAAAIDRCGGFEKVELLDTSTFLPGLKRAKGLKTWKVIDKFGEQWSSFDEVAAEQASSFDEHREKLVESMFPSAVTDAVPLEHCIRLYPHHQDTGGFFVAVLEKKSEIRARPEPTKVNGKDQAGDSTMVDGLESQPVTDPKDANTGIVDQPISEANGSAGIEQEHVAIDSSSEKATADESVSDKKRKLNGEVDTERPAKRPNIQEDSNAVASGDGNTEVRLSSSSGPGPGVIDHDNQRPDLTAPNKINKNASTFEEPFKYLESDHETLQSIYAFYSLDSRFPRDRFLVRNATGIPSKKLYYTSALAKEILTENEGKGMKFVHAGVNMFVKQDVQSEEVCRWRIQMDGLPLIEPWVGERRVMRLHSRTTFRKLLVEMFPKVTGNSWQDLGELGPQALDMPMGCCVLRVEKSDGEDGFGERFVLPIWRSMHSLNLMLPKEDRKAMLLRLYNENTPIFDHTKDRPSQPATTATSSEARGVEAETTENQNGQNVETELIDVDTGSDDEEGGVLLTGTAT